MSASLPRECFRRSPEELLLKVESESCRGCIFVRPDPWTMDYRCALTDGLAQLRCNDYQDTL